VDHVAVVGDIGPAPKGSEAIVDETALSIAAVGEDDRARQTSSGAVQRRHQRNRLIVMARIYGDELARRGSGTVVTVEGGQDRARRRHLERHLRLDQDGDRSPEHLLGADEGSRHMELPTLVSLRDVRGGVGPRVSTTDPPVTSTSGDELFGYKVSITGGGCRHVEMCHQLLDKYKKFVSSLRRRAWLVYVSGTVGGYRLDAHLPRTTPTRDNP